MESEEVVMVTAAAGGTGQFAVQVFQLKLYTPQNYIIGAVNA